MHVAQIGFHLDPMRRVPAELLLAWESLVDVAEAAAGAGVRVSVIQACHVNESFTRNGVRYHFTTAAVQPSGRQSLQGFAALLAGIDADIFHVHGLDFYRQVHALALVAPGKPIILQDHASGLPRFWRRAAWRRGHRHAGAVAFCATGQARPFLAAGLLAAGTPVFAIPESTSRFTPGDRELARLASGVAGNPAVLWVGNLDPNKDPLAVLKGFSLALRELPEAQLWCCYRATTLLPAIKAALAAEPSLAAHVHLLGEASREQVQELMRAADVFVLGSHREGSGYSLIEAIATGLPPVVTDIPSFRELTGDGTIGALWPCGDATRMAQKLLSIASSPGPQLRASVRAHFVDQLSSAAVGNKLATAYSQVIRQSASSGGSRAP